MPKRGAPDIVGRRPAIRRWKLLLAGLVLCVGIGAAPVLAQTSQPLTVTFPSGDGHTTLTGYLFAPVGRPKMAPAIVLLHNRSGVYSPHAKGKFAAITINDPIRDWANLWAAQGFWALVVDSFGPRGLASGLVPKTARTQAAARADLALRPLDAEGALRYLRASPRVRADRIGIEGWGDGATAVLQAMRAPAPGSAPAPAFRAALAVAPDCTLGGHAATPYLPAGPVRIFAGTRDSAAQRTACQRLATAAHAAGGDVKVAGIAAAPRTTGDPDGATPERGGAGLQKQAVALFTAALEQ